MSSMLARLKADQITARKAKNTPEVTFLSTLIGEASAYATAGKQRRDVVDDDVAKAVLKMEKSLNETRGLTKDTAAQAVIDSELAILSRYIPVRMSEDDLRTAIATICQNNEGANKGSIMRALKEAHGGTYDGRAAAVLVDLMLAI